MALTWGWGSSRWFKNFSEWHLLMHPVSEIFITFGWATFCAFPSTARNECVSDWIIWPQILDAEEVWPSACNIHILFPLCLSALARLERAHRDWWVSDLAWQIHSSFLHWDSSCKTYRLDILVVTKQMCELGLKDKPKKHECCLKLDMTSPASCFQTLGVTGFVSCGWYEATISWCNCEFPYGKAPCLKRASKGKDKKNQNHVEGKGNSYLEQIWLQGSSWAKPQSCTSCGFWPRSLPLQPATYHIQCSPSSSVCLLSSPHRFASGVVVVLLFFSITW